MRSSRSRCRRSDPAYRLWRQNAKLFLRARLIELARGRGFELTTPDRADDRGGTVAINPPHAYEVSRELVRRQFLVDFRPGAGIRVSPHFYTADEELDAVVAEMGDIIHNRAYEPHLGAS